MLLDQVGHAPRSGRHCSLAWLARLVNKSHLGHLALIALAKHSRDLDFTVRCWRTHNYAVSSDGAFRGRCGRLTSKHLPCQYYSHKLLQESDSDMSLDT